ncbi:Transcription factor SRM1 [Camellia lanceoleosa]|uniref:Transcription factor SRM1 n=1 Tax=Camellia lanceoleosa TaxID=1840588 RepID=A0ACC0H542_9ERIC|nr:Transcription factor SRM1 [Camellia lanceoleosa]
MFGDHHNYSSSDTNRWSMIGNSSATQSSSSWTKFEDKVFEQALVMFPEEMAERWEMIAEQIPGKSPEEVRAHYEALVHDVLEIDSAESNCRVTPMIGGMSPSLRRVRSRLGPRRRRRLSTARPIGRKEPRGRKKNTGLKTYGKGDWRSISRNVVVTRTPTQVASHAQKYYLRQNSAKKERKRSSIHDITTTVDTNSIPPPPQFPNQGVSTGYQSFNYTM